jgi:hypothetical protein
VSVECPYLHTLPLPHEEVIGVYTRSFGVDNKHIAYVQYHTALAKHKSGDVAGALESARECVRIYDKLGITNEYSQIAAGDMVMRLEGIE